MCTISVRGTREKREKSIRIRHVFKAESMKRMRLARNIGPTTRTTKRILPMCAPLVVLGRHAQWHRSHEPKPQLHSPNTRQIALASWHPHRSLRVQQLSLVPPARALLFPLPPRNGGFADARLFAGLGLCVDTPLPLPLCFRHLRFVGLSSSTCVSPHAKCSRARGPVTVVADLQSTPSPIQFPRALQAERPVDSGLGKLHPPCVCPAVMRLDVRGSQPLRLLLLTNKRPPHGCLHTGGCCLRRLRYHGQLLGVLRPAHMCTAVGGLYAGRRRSLCRLLTASCLASLGRLQFGRRHLLRGRGRHAGRGRYGPAACRVAPIYCLDACRRRHLLPRWHVDGSRCAHAAT
mmetsp:Transcript_73934/g.164287  ORF Transcript_73934/g.164287 Transcript_73934/m.164287 type:complete len:347 (+) Transcript_73934:111-1151(+)